MDKNQQTKNQQTKSKQTYNYRKGLRVKDEAVAYLAEDNDIDRRFAGL